MHVSDWNESLGRTATSGIFPAPSFSLNFSMGCEGFSRGTTAFFKNDKVRTLRETGSMAPHRRMLVLRAVSAIDLYIRNLSRYIGVSRQTGSSGREADLPLLVGGVCFVYFRVADNTYGKP